MTVLTDGSVIEFFEPKEGFSDAGIAALCAECGVGDMLGGSDGYGRVVAVAKAEGRTVGYMCALYVADSADIGSVCVAGDFRRRHIGTAMLRGTVGILAGKGIESVWLEVRESNAAARALYSSIGFRESGTIKNYYRAPAEDAVRMTLATGENEDTLV